MTGLSNCGGEMMVKGSELLSILISREVAKAVSDDVQIPNCYANNSS
jgi:hypothetical protein